MTVPKQFSSVSFALTMRYFDAEEVPYPKNTEESRWDEMIDLFATVSGSALTEKEVGLALESWSEERGEILTRKCGVACGRVSKRHWEFACCANDGLAGPVTVACLALVLRVPPVCSALALALQTPLKCPFLLQNLQIASIAAQV